VKLAIIGAILLIATTSHADDDPPEIQHMRFVERGDQLLVSSERPGGIGKLFDRGGYDALSTGIPSIVVIRIQITPQDSDEPVAEQLIRRQVVRDIWDDVYTLQIDQRGARSRTIKVRSPAEALKRLTVIEDLPIARLRVLPINKVFVLKLVAELNPVSKETLAEVHRWLSQGNGGGLDRGGAFFGSFVSLFYNPKIADADRVLRIRSQPFFRPPP
jgi:hypothetical protein